MRDYINTTQITFNRFDKQGNDLLYIYVNLLNNGGTIYGISEDGEKFFHIVSPDRDIRSGHSFLLLPNSSISTGKLQFQDTTSIPSDGAPDDGLIAMESFSAGTKVFVNFIPNIAPPTTIDGISGPIVLASTLELGGPSGSTLDINVDNLAVVRSFNGATGAIDTTSLVLPVTGLSASGGVTLSGDLSLAGDIISQDDNLAIRGPGGSEILMSFLGSQTIINNSATDQDIIIKGVGDSQLFVTDAGNNRVGIGTSTPTEKLDVTGTIKATTGITLGAGGITFADGTFQDTAARAGLKYTVTSGSPSAGEVGLGIDIGGVIDQLVLHDTDAHGNDISGILSLFADNGGYIQVLKDDGSALIGVAVDASETSVATFGSDKLTIQQVLVDFEIEEQVPSAGDTVYIDINPSLVSAVQSIGGSNSWNKGAIQLANGLTAHNFGGIGVGYLQVEQSAIDFDGFSPNITVAGITFSDNTQQKTAPKGVGTFTVSASSAISTGAKTDALHRIPYNATLTKFELKSKATGGMTAAVYIAGSDFGNPTTGFITGATAEITGLTGETTTFGTASVTGGDFIYLHVLANASGATAAQAFVSYETR